MHSKIDSFSYSLFAPSIRTFSALTIAIIAFAGIEIFAADLSWDANGTTTGQTDGGGAWLDASRWWDSAANASWTSGDTATFGNGGSGGSVTLVSPTTVDSLTFNSFTGTYTLGSDGQLLTINSGIDMTSDSGDVTFVGPITLGGEQTWTNNSADTLITGRSANLIDNAGHQLTIDGSGTIRFGVINVSDVALTGAGALIKNGPGRLIVGGNNPGFTGPVSINEGILHAYHNAGVLGSGNLKLSGGVLSFYWKVTYNRTLGTGSNQVQILGGESGFAGTGSAPTINLGSTIVWGAAGEGVATGYFNPAKFVLGDSGTGNAASTKFSSGIDLNGAMRNIYVPFGLSATGNTSTLTSSISNSVETAGLIKDGGGRLILSVANSYNGGTTIQAGTLELGNVASMGPSNSALTVNDGLLDLNNMDGVTVGNLTGTGGMIANNGASNSTLTIGAGDGSGGNFQGAIADTTGADSGTLSLTKVGTGIITLSGTNTYSGATTISGGTLQIGAGGTSGSLATSAVAVAIHATLIYDRSDDFSLGYEITGSGALVKQGAGSLTFANPDLSSDHIAIDGGTLKFDQPNTANEAASMTIAETGATLHLDFSGTQTLGDLYIGATLMPNGVYKAIGSPLPGTELAQITGPGTLTVTGDIYPPTLVSIEDDIDTYAVASGSPVTYTITFNEDIDSSTVSAADFANAGTAPITVGTIAEISPGVFTVVVTPTDGGTLQLAIPVGANITDALGNALDTSAEISDNTSVPTYALNDGAIQFIGNSPIATNVGSTLTMDMPAGAQPGDLLIVNVVNWSSGDRGDIYRTGTDWNFLSEDYLSGDVSVQFGLYYREVLEGDGPTFALELGGGAPYAAAGVILAFSNVDLATGPEDGSGASRFASASDPTSSIESTYVYSNTPNALFLFLGMAMGDSAVNFSNWQNPLYVSPNTGPREGSSVGALDEIYDISGDAGFKTISFGAAIGTKETTALNNGCTADLSGTVHNAALQIPLRSTTNDSLASALLALKAHVTGETPLSSTQIGTHIDSIVSNRLSFRSSVDSIAAALDFVHAYDEELGPLWVTRSLPKRTSLQDDIHHAVFKVMQYLLDYSFSTTNLNNNYDLLNNFVFGSSAHFPGSCSAPADPSETHTVLIDADYPNTWGRDVFGQTEPSPKPTGTYLAPGSIATVTVPQALVGRGYRVRVGAHGWDLSDKPYISRLDRVTTSYAIDSTTMQVANPLGGGIYIEVPKYIEDVGVVSVQVQNAVRSPYFSAKSFHQTTLTEWQNVERHHSAPWADFQSEKVMMQVPTDWIYAMDDPVTLMADWDHAVDILNDLMGFPHDRGRETIYNQVDLQLRAVAYTPGYPAVNNTYNPNTDYGGYADNYLVRGPQYAPDNEFHELGHAYKFPKFPGEVESDVNILHVPVFMGFGYSIDEAFRESRSGPEYVTLDTTAIAWMMCDNFLNGAEGSIMEDFEKQYAYKGHAKFIEVARLFGWERLGNYFKSFNEDDENGVNTVEEVDSLLLRLSERVGIDVRPLFHFWGVPPINASALESSIQSAELPSSGMIYDTLVRYKSLVPADNASFRTFANGWWGQQPLSTGFSEERNHADRWDNYDETMAAATAARAQQIIDLYFPDGRPSDYGDWRSQWEWTGMVQLDPQVDLDGDGVSNDDERIWGLDPTSATSRTPILPNANLNSGRFTYTRRGQALTGINFSVWTSTDLVDWNEDTGAQQLPGALDSKGVEEVETMLTPELLDSPSLFIQLRSNE